MTQTHHISPPHGHDYHEELSGKRGLYILFFSGLNDLIFSIHKINLLSERTLIQIDLFELEIESHRDLFLKTVLPTLVVQKSCRATRFASRVRPKQDASMIK